MSKRTRIQAFSAGGVVFRPTQGGAEVALVGRPHERLWTLPKGTPNAGETREMTALREVREESGIEARIIGEVGEIGYEFSRKGRQVSKQVFHYLMLAVGGALDEHDHEYDEARWFSLADAIRTLTYENEKDIVRQAEPRIRAWMERKAGD